MNVDNKEHGKEQPKQATKDAGNCDTFTSYSSGYLSQDSFVDLTNKQDNLVSNIHADAAGYSGKNIEQTNDISRNENKLHTDLSINDSMGKQSSAEVIGSSNDTEFSQEVILPDSINMNENEDEPMVFITKPCLPPGKKPKDRCSKPSLSSSKTVTELMHHLSLKRDKKKTSEPSNADDNSGSNGFSHLEWSSSVPYNLAEEPDDCKGMKHSHSCQSMPSVSENQAANKLSSESNSNTLMSCEKQDPKIMQSIEQPKTSVIQRDESNEEKTVAELLLETMDSTEDELKSVNETADDKNKKLEDSVAKEVNPETNLISISSNHEKKRLHDDTKQDENRIVETLQEKRSREQKILSQKLDEFRKNSRSTKADQIKLCSDRQMRAKSEDIIVKPFQGNSKKNCGKETNKDMDNSFSKRHSSTFGITSKELSINKNSFKKEKPKRPPLDELERNRRRLASDSDVCYSEFEKLVVDRENGAKPKKMSLVETAKSSDRKDSTSRKSMMHKLSAPHLVQTLSTTSSTYQGKDEKSDKNATLEDDPRNLTSKSRKSATLPSPPKEFKDLPLVNGIKEVSHFSREDTDQISSQNKIEDLDATNKTVKLNVGTSKNKTERMDNLANSNLLRQSKLEKMKKKIPDISLNTSKEENPVENVNDRTQMTNSCQSKKDLKSRKNNMFSNCQIIAPMIEHDPNSEKAEIMNINEKRVSIGGSNDNRLVVVDRRDSTVDCMESTPLPSPNLSEKSKINFSEIYAKNQLQSKQSPSKQYNSNRLGVKRYGYKNCAFKCIIIFFDNNY